MPAPWRPDSWRGKPIVQVPEYPDQAALEDVERNLRNFPPLVFIKEVRDLKDKLAGVAPGRGRSCCRAATARRASRSTRPTTSATISSCSCRWR